MNEQLEDEANRHVAELVRLTLRAADQGLEPLPEDELATLGMVIAIERQLLIDAMSGLLHDDEPDAAASPGWRSSTPVFCTDLPSLEPWTTRGLRSIA